MATDVQALGAPPIKRRLWWHVAPLTILALMLAKAGSLVISGFGTSDRWYDSLRQPFALPMEWVYPGAWPVICVVLGTAWAIMLTVKPSRPRLLGLIAFYAVLALSLIWVPVFRVAHDIAMAKYMLGAITILLIASLFLFFSLRRVAGLLLIPYLLWVIFVTSWMIGLERLNPAAGKSITELSEGKSNAVREENRRRSREGDEWDRRDDGRDGARGERRDPREDARMDRGERRDRPRGV